MATKIKTLILKNGGKTLKLSAPVPPSFYPANKTRGTRYALAAIGKGKSATKATTKHG